LAAKLKERPVSLDELEQVQKRREFPVRLIQTIQVQAHRRITGRTSGTGDTLPLIPRLFELVPPLRALPERLMGIGQ